MTYTEALKIHFNPRIRKATKLREAARTIFARGRTADYQTVLALFDRAEAIEKTAAGEHR